MDNLALPIYSYLEEFIRNAPFGHTLRSDSDGLELENEKIEMGFGCGCGVYLSLNTVPYISLAGFLELDWKNRSFEITPTSIKVYPSKPLTIEEECTAAIGMVEFDADSLKLEDCAGNQRIYELLRSFERLGKQSRQNLLTPAQPEWKDTAANLIEIAFEKYHFPEKYSVWLAKYYPEEMPNSKIRRILKLYPFKKGV